MNDILWSKEQMGLRKLANQFLAHVDGASAQRILITSVEKGDGKARFMTELAAELSRIRKDILPLALPHLSVVSPDRLEKKLVIVYGPSYRDTEGLHTIPEKWMRTFDAAVIVVMLRKTKQKELMQLVSWLQEYGVKNIWPIVNEYRVPSFAQMWMRIKIRLGLYKSPQSASSEEKMMFWAPLLPPIKELRALPPGSSDADHRSDNDDDETNGIIEVAKTPSRPLKQKAVSVSSVPAKSPEAETSNLGSTLIGTASPVANMRREKNKENTPPSTEYSVVKTTESRIVTSYSSDKASEYRVPKSRATIISSSPPAPHLTKKRDQDKKDTDAVVIQSVTKKISSIAPARETPSESNSEDVDERHAEQVTDISQFVRITQHSLAPPPSANNVDHEERYRTGGRNDEAKPAKEDISVAPIISAKATIRSTVPPPGGQSKKDSKNSDEDSSEESS
jgi:hypothetical protein